MNIFPFCYTVNAGTIVDGGTADPVSVQISSKQDFVLTALRAVGNTGITLNIADANGTNFTSKPVQTALLKGSNGNGLVLLQPVLIPKSTNLIFTFYNNSGTGDVADEQLQLWGYEQ